MARGKPGLVMAALCAALLGACGSSDSGTSGGRPQTAAPGRLARLVPPGVFSMIAEADYLAARKALGLPADADPRDGLHGSGAARRFAEAVLPTTPFYAGPQPIPIARVLDGGRIQAAAAEGRGGASEVIVLRTTQPFEEIAAGLVKAGYKRVGRLLNYTGNVNDVRYPEVVHAPEDEGLIAISGERTRGFAALGAEPVAPNARPELALLGRLPPAPVRIADAAVVGASCASVGVADELTDGRGELVVRVAGEPPSEAALVLDESVPGLKLGKVAVSNNELRAPITFPLSESGAPGTAVVHAFGSRTYRCRRGSLPR